MLTLPDTELRAEYWAKWFLSGNHIYPLRIRKQRYLSLCEELGIEPNIRHIFYDGKKVRDYHEFPNIPRGIYELVSYLKASDGSDTYYVTVKPIYQF